MIRYMCLGTDTDDNDNTRLLIHDYMGSLGFMPNESKGAIIPGLH